MSFRDVRNEEKNKFNKNTQENLKKVMVPFLIASVVSSAAGSYSMPAIMPEKVTGDDKSLLKVSHINKKTAYKKPVSAKMTPRQRFHRIKR